MNERRSFTSYLGEFTWNITDLLRVEVRGDKNIDELDNHLARGGKVVGIHDHEGTFDPLLMLKLFKKRLKHLLKIGYVGSMKFFDKRIPSFGLMDFLQEDDVEFWPVLQPNDEEGLQRLEEENRIRDQNNQAKLTREQINLVTLRRSVNFLRRMRSSALLFCPQGTRNPIMLEPSTHILEIVENEENAHPGDIVIAPISISGSGQVLQKGHKIPNPFASVVMTVCPLLSYQDIIRRSSTLAIPPSHAMMLNIAVLKPEDFWGVHREDIHKLVSITGVNNPQQALELLRK